MTHNQPGSSANPQLPLYEDNVSLKIRRVINACDLCRKRKARCDGDPTSPKGCTPCENSGVACVFTCFTRKKGYGSSQARELETRIIEIEGIIRLMAPGIDIERELDDSAYSSNSADNPQSFLRPSDSAFLHPSTTFLPPSADSTSAFLHPENNLYQISSPEEGNKPNIYVHPLSPHPLPTMNAAYSYPGMSGTLNGTPYPSLSPSSAGPSIGLSGSQFRYYSELSYTEGPEVMVRPRSL
ncbi:hypothetical protein BDV93DRAFT_231652 [Ceratobasidium sp. AG-I]|nr:hypothetical protein BDV93DRAFT_231652 [Ceratobasidium sp. AG-I]